MKKMFVLLLLIMCGMMTGAACTPESPPLPPVYGDDSSSAVLIDSSAPDGDDTAAPVTAWDDNNGELLEISFHWIGEGGASDFIRTDDKEMLDKLRSALKGIRVIKESEERVTDDSTVILYTADRKSGRIDFEHGGLVKDGKRYDIEGYTALQTVLNEIEDRFPEWKKKYDEWIHRMSEASDRIKEVTTGYSYQKADTEARRTTILKLLHTLETDGLVKDGSIYDDGGTISFMYNCSEEGVCGGIMIKDPDPMMN